MRALALIIAVFAYTSAASADVTGRASVTDGDTIEIHGERIRLFGIDAPESRQLCSVAGQPYRCGQQAALALADHLGQRTVRCEERDRDRYGRTVATCYVGDEDVSGWAGSAGLGAGVQEVLDALCQRGGRGASGRARDLARQLRCAVGVERRPAVTGGTRSWQLTGS